ncbi:MAG: DUF4097 domain-containing protein [Bacteroidetes bacterium]|jgi:hypothetical protein|nr:DUF4097 domain-containing protein [Bacteroidota bacterium]
MRNLKFINSIAIILFFATGMNAQTTLQVVTKTIEKTIPYKDGYELNIEGEKAEIQVEAWDKADIKVHAKLIAKHPSKATAQKDLESMEFNADQHGDMIYFRNYVSTPDGESAPESDLSAVYTITLPEDCPLYLKNHFGLTKVNNLTNSLKIQSEYSKVLLDNLSGKISLDSYFGDIEGKNINGDVRIDSRRSNITLYDIMGVWDINAQYGILKLFTDPMQNLVSLDITAEKADVYFFDPNPSFYGYNLTAHYGNITAPVDLKFNYIENTQEVKKAIFSSKLGGKGNVYIKISFGDIVIRNP